MQPEKCFNQGVFPEVHLQVVNFCRWQNGWLIRFFGYGKTQNDNLYKSKDESPIDSFSLERSCAL